VGEKIREKWNEQLGFSHIMPNNKVARELGAISDIIDANPQIMKAIYKDIAGGKRSDTGREGMTAEQVLRCRRT